jgi:NAD(P)-dependent dehydrogenase (short-subunit alcohol dehydrogenase family)
VVTGGAGGIGAAIAAELARQGEIVVILDPGVTVDGTGPQPASPEPSVVERIAAAGGQARLCKASVADAAAVRSLFGELAAEFGSIDIVVNAAGIIRGTTFTSGTEADWRAELDVHLNGYLNVLEAAVPIMARAGYGRILGVTSGAGWRASDAGAYSCAKRAVAALTWAAGRAMPAGVCLNALSPVAMTRMVSTALAGSAARPAPDRKATGGLALAALPPPQDLAAVGAFLVSEQVGWCRGQVIFSSGAEVAMIAPPRRIELVATGGDAATLRPVLDRALTVVFGPAERTQVTSGAAAPRFSRPCAARDNAEVPPAPADSTRSRPAGHCLIVTASAEFEFELSTILAEQGHKVTGGVLAFAGRTAGGGFAAAAAAVAQAARTAGPVDTVVVALGHESAPGPAGSGSTAPGGWDTLLAGHRGVADAIIDDVAWTRAVTEYAIGASRPVRLITAVPAASPGGRTRAQAAAQLTRGGLVNRQDHVDAFAVSLQGTGPSARRALIEFIAQLIGRTDAGELAGAELEVTSEWVGLRSHPAPAGSIAFGEPGVPPWLPAALQSMTGEMRAPA